MQDVSEKLNYLLRVHALNQNELAEKVGVSKQVINSLCSGKVKTSKALYSIANFFGVEYIWLTNHSEDKKKSIKQVGDDILLLDGISQSVLRDLEAEIGDLYRPPSGRQRRWGPSTARKDDRAYSKNHEHDEAKSGLGGNFGRRRRR